MLESLILEVNEMDEKYYSVKELTKTKGGILPMSISALYAAIRRGDLKCVRIGKRILIPESVLNEILSIKA